MYHDRRGKRGKRMVLKGDELMGKRVVEVGRG